MNIEVKSENKCTGCGICESVCPVEAIQMDNDKEGFYNPRLMTEKCIDCGKCYNSCPKYKEDANVYIDYCDTIAAWSKSKNDILSSSSGGVGYILGKFGLENGFDVWGVIYDTEKECAKHVRAMSHEDLSHFKGSKYLQSNTKELMQAIVEYNANPCGKQLMIFGTPCQIRTIRENIYDNSNVCLIDVFCRGVPTYLLWRKYLETIREKIGLSDKIDVNFRDKCGHDWHDCQMTISNDEGVKYSCISRADPYYKIYTSALCFRDSCYECDLKLNNSYADIRIGDFWGNRFADREDGVSIVIPNTKKGKWLIDQVRGALVIEAADFEDVKEAQKYINNKWNKKIRKMRRMLADGTELDRIYSKLVKPPLFKRVILESYKLLPESAKDIYRTRMKRE